MIVLQDVVYKKGTRRKSETGLREMSGSFGSKLSRHNMVTVAGVETKGEKKKEPGDQPCRKHARTTTCPAREPPLHLPPSGLLLP